MAFFSALMSLQPAALAYVAKLIVDGVVAAVKTGTQEARERVLWLVAVELGLSLAMSLLQRLNGLISSLVRARLGNLINERILEKALTLELKHCEDPSLYDKLQNARREASSRPLSLAQSALNVL